MKSTSMIWKGLAFAILAALSVYVVLTTPGGGEVKIAETSEQTFLQKRLPGIRLGIDLAGGTSFTVEVDRERLRADIAAEHTEYGEEDLNKAVEERLKGAEDRVLEVLRKRVDGMGVNEPVIFKGRDRIVIQLPGANAEQREMAQRSIESAAFLEFRLVHKDNDTRVAELLTKTPPKGFVMHESGQGYVRTKDYDALYRDPEYRRGLSRFGNVPNHVMMLEKTSRRGQGEMYVPYFVSNKRELDGSALTSAKPEQNINTGEMQVSFTMGGKGAAIFRNLTSKHRPGGSENPSQNGRKLAI
ncbi:MAG: hypothetical protein FWF96_06245, partial [Kiritimatiellaeota bacterium]|nr:hypothetical protein [Kiritimatiellota bacterium]